MINFAPLISCMSNSKCNHGDATELLLKATWNNTHLPKGSALLSVMLEKWLQNKNMFERRTVKRSVKQTEHLI